LWRSGIELRKKLILSFIFGMICFTIAVTIVRGSVFTRVWGKQSNDQRPLQSASVTWFWFYTEFSVAIIIACVVSFRTLFVNRDNKAKNRFRENERRNAFLESKAHKRWQNKARQLHRSLLETCRDLEGQDLVDSGAESGVLDVPSGLMTVDFNDDTNWTKTITTVNTNDTNNHSSFRQSISMQSLLKNQTSIPTERQEKNPRT
jgi:cell division protein FtsX